MLKHFFAAMLALVCIIGQMPAAHAASSPQKENETLLLPKLEKVVVFTRGAQLTQSVKHTLKPGNNTVVMDKIPTNADINSLQIRLSNGVTLMETYQRTAPAPPYNAPESFMELLTEDLRTEYKKITQEQTDIAYKQQKLQLQSTSFAQEKAHLEKYMNNLLTNPPVAIMVPPGYTASSMPEFKAELNAFRVKIDDIHDQIVSNMRLQAEAQETLNKNQVRMQEIQSRAVPPPQPTGWEQTRLQLVLLLNTEAAATAEIEISYLIYDAGWVPSYDIRSKNAQSALTMVYKAGIFQRSGLDWNNVNITVSTANAYASNERPIMYPQSINIYVPVPMQPDDNPGIGTGYDNEKPQLMTTNSYYAAPAAPVMAELDMVANKKLTGRKNAKDKEDLNYAQGISTDIQTLLSVEYEIRLPQTIPNDGIAHTVIMKDQTVNAIYRYHSVPKLDKGAFLIAKVAEWGTLNLLAGTANLFLENKYVGKTTINPASTSDTLLLSLGRDEKINVKREKTECKTEHNLLKTKTNQTHTIEFTVLNTKNVAVEMELLDQIPITQNPDIEIEILESNNAEYTKELGKLLWKVNLKPNESRKIRLRYVVRYPYGKTITGNVN
jgi:uncharacterized protein (TIGR02231 family)